MLGPHAQHLLAYRSSTWVEGALEMPALSCANVTTPSRRTTSPTPRTSEPTGRCDVTASRGGRPPSSRSRSVLCRSGPRGRSRSRSLRSSRESRRGGLRLGDRARRGEPARRGEALRRCERSRSHSRSRRSRCPRSLLLPRSRSCLGLARLAGRRSSSSDDVESSEESELEARLAPFLSRRAIPVVGERRGGIQRTNLGRNQPIALDTGPL